MKIPLFQKLQQQHLITDEEFQCIAEQQYKPLSIRQELLILLYAGILLLASGLGIIVYKNIDSIGHMAILIFIALVCAACFVWSIKKQPPYTRQKAETPHFLLTYLVLLGSLLLLVFIGYMQYAYQPFGQRWGLATFIPMVLLFIIAYYFDHLGVLSLAITNLAAWAGITVAPLQIIRDNDFSNERLIFTGIFLGIFLWAVSWITARKQYKPHFAFTYQNFGMHILFIALLAALFRFERVYFLVFLLIMGIAYLCFVYAQKTKSYYMLVVSSVYGYIALSYTITRFMMMLDSRDLEAIYAILIYYISSGILFILFLIHYNKKLKADAGI